MLELAMVVAISLAVGVAAVGSYSQARRGRAPRTAAEAVLAAFTTARAYAVSTNGTFRVVLQLRDPVTARATRILWIDEIFPGGSTAANPIIPETPKTAKLSTPYSLPEDVRFADIFVSTDSESTTATSTSDNFAVIRFKPDGTSDEATVRIVDEAAATADGNLRAYSVRLSRPTAKPRILSGELR